MTGSRMRDRRALARALSRAANATVAEALAVDRATEDRCHRIGITGPPGVGKSSLIARLAGHRLQHPGDLAMAVIDPTSPISGGAILGDRIRMEELATDPRVYIRSIASRDSLDGLADNLPDILATFASAGFAEMIVETVGVGQVEHAVRSLVDTLVLTLMPGTGDQIQAMKGGLLETADIYVINKADLPGAAQLRAELHGVLKARTRGTAEWLPKIILVSADDPAGPGELSTTIDRHRGWLDDTGQRRHDLARRKAHHVGSLITRRLGEVLRALPPDTLQRPLAELYRAVAGQLVDEQPGERTG
jgi:LAO/AO transport system kinase